MKTEIPILDSSVPDFGLDEEVRQVLRQIGSGDPLVIAARLHLEEQKAAKFVPGAATGAAGPAEPKARIAMIEKIVQTMKAAPLPAEAPRYSRDELHGRR